MIRLAVSPIDEWLDRCQALCKNPDELRALADTVKDANSRWLLKRRATQWGVNIMKENTRHWSSGKA